MLAEVQAIAYAVGKTGCYYLSTLGVSESAGGAVKDPLETFIWAKKQGILKDDAYMLDPAKLVSALVGGKWVVLKAGNGNDSSGSQYALPLDYRCRKDEFEVLRFQRNSGPGETVDDAAHFVQGDGNGNVLFDPWGDSKTVREGWLVSRRIFRKIA